MTATDRTPTSSPAILVPLRQSDPANIEDRTNLTQADPVVGEVVPSQLTRLVLEGVGTMKATTDLELRVLRGGPPGRGLRSCGLGWRRQGDTDWRGRNVPNLRTGWEPLVWVDGTGVGVVHCEDPHAVTFSDGTVVTAVQVQATVGSNNHHVVVYIRDPDDDSWSTSSPIYVHSQSAAWSWGAEPCLVRIPDDDTLILLHWVEDSAADEAQVRMHYSTDKGQTWSLGGSYVLPTAISISTSTIPADPGYKLGKLRAAWVEDEVLLMVELVTRSATAAYSATYAQFASTTRGASFEEVERGDGSDVHGRFEVLAVGGRFLVLHIGGNSGDDESLFVRELSSAQDAFSDQAEFDITSVSTWGDYSTTDGYLDGTTDLAACVDDDGSIYVVANNTDSGGWKQAVGIYRSEDEGTTWEPMGESPATTTGNAGVVWYQASGSAQIRPRQHTLTPHGGRLLWLHTCASATGTYDDSLQVTYLGGWGTITAPGLNLFPAPNDRVSWSTTCIPCDLPSQQGWTYVGGKTASVNSSGRWDLDSTSGAGYWERVPTTAVDEGVGGHFVAFPATLASTTAANVGAKFRQADGAKDHEVVLRIGNGAVNVYDTTAAASLGTLNVNTDDGVHLLVWMASGQIFVAARPWSSAPDYQWTTTLQAAVADAGASARGNYIAFGALAVSAAPSQWLFWDDVVDSYVGRGMQDGFDNPTDLFPGPCTPLAFPVIDGARVRAKDGPGFEGQSYAWAAAFRHPVDAGMALGAASRARPWRTTGKGSVVRVPIALDDTSDVALPDSVALAVLGANLRDYSLRGHTGGAWTTLATANTSAGRVGKFTRVGNRVVPAVGTAWTKWSRPGSLVGCVVKLSDGVTTRYRRVEWNHGGLWDPSTTGRQEILHLEGVDGSEPTSGDIEVWEQDTVIVAHLGGVRYRALELYIPVQDTVDDYFELAHFDLYKVVPCAPAPSAAWVRTWEPGTELEESEDGTAAPVQLRSLRRRYEIPWVDLQPVHHVHGANPEPGYVKSSTVAGALPTAAWGAMAYEVIGIARDHNGPSRPLIWVEQLDVLSGSSQQVGGYDELLYAWLDNAPRLERVNPYALRMRGLTLREVL